MTYRGSTVRNKSHDYYVFLCTVSDDLRVRSRHRHYVRLIIRSVFTNVSPSVS